MNRQRIDACTHLFVQSLGKRERAVLRFDQGKVAIVGADAGDQAAYKGRGTRRELLQ